MKSVIGIDHRSAHGTCGLGCQKGRQRTDLFDAYQFSRRRTGANLIHQRIEPVDPRGGAGLDRTG